MTTSTSLPSTSGFTSIGGSGHVFISYAREDDQLVTRLESMLREAGVDAWRDTSNLLGGDQWIKGIEHGIRESYAVIFVVSEQSRKSSWVMREVIFAEKKGKKIIPLGLDGGDVPIYAGHLQKLDGSISLNNCFPPLIKILNETRVNRAEPTGPTAPPPDKQTGFAQARGWYLDRVLLKHSIWRDQYTPMAGIAELQDAPDEIQFRTTGTQIDQEFEAFLLEHDSPSATRLVEREADDIIKMLGPQSDGTGETVRRAAILGEPGAGKTTTLWRLVLDYAETALRDQHAPIPILVSLGNYDQGGSLVDHLNQVASPLLGDLGIALDDLIASNQVVLMLDGLNEISPAHLKSGVNAIRVFLKAHRDVPLFITCRELEYSQLDVGLAKIHIKPLDPIRIRNFVCTYIEDGEAGQNLFWQLAGPNAANYWDRFSQRGISEFDFWLGKRRPVELVWSEPWDQWMSLCQILWKFPSSRPVIRPRCWAAGLPPSPPF